MRRVIPADSLRRGIPADSLRRGIPADSLRRGIPADSLRRGIPADLLVFPLLLALLGLLLPTSCYGIAFARRLFFGASLSLSMLQTLAIAACAAFPVATVVGALFGAAVRARRSMDAGAALPTAPLALYLAEAVGSFAGGLIASFLLAPLLSTLQIALAASAAAFLVGAFFALRLSGSILTALSLCVPCAAAAAVLAIPAAHRAADIALARLRFPGRDVVAVADSRYQNFAALRSRESISLYNDGVLTYFSQAGEREEEIAHLALLSRKSPSRLLLIGSGWPPLVQEILKHPVESLDLIVEDERIHRIGLDALSAEKRAIFSDPRLRIRYGDPSMVLKDNTRTYDAVFLDLGVPDTLRSVRFHTREFLQRLRGLLDRDGVVVTTAPSVQSYLSSALLSLNGSLYATLKEVLGSVIVLPAEYAGNLFVSGKEIDRDQFQPARLAGTLEERKIEARWINRFSLATILEPERVAELNRRISGASGTLNTRENPFLLLFSLEYREEMSAGSLPVAFLRGFRFWKAAAVFFALALALALVQRRVQRDIVLPSCAAGAGFSGMVAELSLLCVFQIFSGNLYEMIACLVGLFMAGLALGAVIAAGISRRAELRVKAALSAALFLGLGVAIVIASLTERFVSAPGAVFDLSIGLAMILAGLCSGASVSLLLFESAIRPPDRAGRGGGAYHHPAVRPGSDSRAGLIYGADLIGGALGGAFTSILFLPVVGITRSLWLAVMGYGFALLLLLGSRPFPRRRAQ